MDSKEYLASLKNAKTIVMEMVSVRMENALVNPVSRATTVPLPNVQMIAPGMTMERVLRANANVKNSFKD